MSYKKVLDKCVEHKHALIFAAGIATAIAGKKYWNHKHLKIQPQEEWLP